MKRVSILAKGNVDVHDSLHSCRIGGNLVWNGLNEVVRQTHADTVVRLRHETLTRFDALLEVRGEVPQILVDRDLPLGTYPLSSQFSDKVYTAPVDAIILSILPDVASTLLRHNQDGFLFYPADLTQWSEADREWLRENFAPTGLADVTQSMASLAGIVARIREAHDVPILVYNMSPIIPGDWVHCHLGLDETYATRIRRFNLALIELSQTSGISIVDVDGVVARHGADRMKLDAMHLTPAGYRHVAAEVVRILDDLGVMEIAG